MLKGGWSLRTVLAAFIAAGLGQGLHAFEDLEHDDHPCPPGLNLECGGCADGTHHHHRGTGHDPRACRTCASIALIAAPLERAEDVVAPVGQILVPEGVHPQAATTPSASARGPPAA